MLSSPLLSVITYLSIIAVLYFIYSHIVLAGNDPKAGTKNFLSNIFMIVVPVIALFILLSLSLYDPTTVSYVAFGALFAGIVIYACYYFLQTTLSQYIFNVYLLYIVIAAIFLFGLSIVYTIFSGTLRKMTGWTGFFINFLFYIPCLIRDAVGAVIKEYSTFSNTLVVLFAIEVILLMIYFFMIPFVNSKIFPDKVVLLEEPAMLNTGMPLKTPVDISNNFGLSMWAYVNPGANNKPGYAKESAIFSLLDASGNNHIKLTYSNADQGNNDFIMYVGEQAFPMSLPLQKWHNFVFNYVTYDTDAPSSTGTPGPTSKPPELSMWQYLLSYFYKTPKPTLIRPMVHQTTVDMFVNGNLERSFTYDGISKHIPIVKNNSRISIGNLEENLVMAADGVKGANNSNRDGLYGSICNIVYYKEPVTKMALVYNYNLMVIQNPPV
jgi:hypothetical protein